MDMNHFIEQLEHIKSNASEQSEVILIEAIEKGYMAIHEGWADPVDVVTEDALTRANRMAASKANSIGIPVLDQIQRWGKQNSTRYGEDAESELDLLPTSDVNHRQQSPITKPSQRSNLGKLIPRGGF
jgi:hypothetical protein